MAIGLARATAIREARAKIVNCIFAVVCGGLSLFEIDGRKECIG